MSLTACMPKFLKPKTASEIPKEWKKPPYKPIKEGYVKVGDAMCISLEDAKAVIENQKTCDVIRKDLLDHAGQLRRKIPKEENSKTDK